MLDIQFIRDNTDLVNKHTKQKGYKVDIGKLLELDAQRRKLTAKIDEVRASRNVLAASSKNGKPTDEVIKKGKELKEQLSVAESELAPVASEFSKLHKLVPNLASDDTPVGESEDENKVVYEWGDKQKFDFEPKNHWQIAEARGWLDKKRAAKVAGARFAYLKGDLVKLQMALMAFTLDIVTNEDTIAEIIKAADLNGLSTKPFTPVIPPFMIKTDLFDAMDRLEPRDDRYKIEDEELWLQGSAEHVLGAMHSNEVIPESELPLRYLGYATSFRREAGTYGKDMEGIIRTHQFDKMEMETFASAKTGMQEHLLTVAIQEYLLRQLKLPYRMLLKCTADIGKPNFRGVDMDVWLPGQNKYCETHTADYMTDYQTRRLNVRTKTSQGSEYLHTIDATAFAFGRAMVGIIENGQTAEGKVKVPVKLQPYLGGRDVL